MSGGAGSKVTAPRCLQPVKPYKLSRYPGESPAAFPVCWRRKGHATGRHLSRAAYLRELDRAIRRNKRRPRAQGLAA